MRHILTGHDNVVGPWVASRVGTVWSPERSTTIGLFSVHTGLLAGVIYEGFNGANIGAHIASVPGKDWPTQGFLRFIFHYPFEQLGVKRITGLVASSNKQAVEFNLRLGFELEATLKDAHPEGDLLMFVMRKENCRWLKQRKGVQNG